MEEISTSPEENKNQDVKKIKIIPILILIIAVLAVISIPFVQKYQFQKSTDTDFASVPNRDLDSGDLEKLKAKYDKAEQVLSGNGYDLEANLVKADVLFTMQEDAKAETIYKKLQELYPSDARAFERLGEIYSSQKRYEDAQQLFSKAINKDPKNLDAYLRLAMVYRATNKEKDQKDMVDKFYQDGIQNLGDDKLMLVDEYASFLERAGEYNKAIEQLNILLANSPDDQDIKDRIAELQAKLTPTGSSVSAQ